MKKTKKHLIVTYLIALFFTSQLLSPDVYADTNLGGTITFDGKDGQKLNLPSLKTDLKVDIESDMVIADIMPFGSM